MAFNHFHSRRSGFTLIEVVLALGVFLVSVLALIGLLAPMLQSVDEVEKIDEITSVVATVDTFLQSSPDIGIRESDPNDNEKTIITKTKFDAIYEAIHEKGEATIFIYRYYDDQGDSEGRIRLEIGFSADEGKFVGVNSIVNQSTSSPASFNEAAGPIYRVVLTASSVTPVALRSPGRDTEDGIYTLTEADVENYPEGFLALEARIFAEDPPGPAPAEFDTVTNLSELNDREPDFTFNTAIVR